MGYHLSTGWGDEVDNPSLEQMAEILASPWITDVEHGEAWLTHETEWTLSFNGNDRLTWQCLEGDSEPRHMKGVSRQRVLRLWCKLAAGKIAEIEREPWQPGYGAEPLTEAQRAEIEAAVRERDRRFYDSLGAERADTPCREPGCTRGAVVASVLCRVHHFEAVQHKACPFRD